jgi:hypothetical protein
MEHHLLLLPYNLKLKYFKKSHFLYNILTAYPPIDAKILFLIFLPSGLD